jgi:hypothetical protein
VKTALFAWELGGNLGHAFPMAAVARRLLADSQDLRIVVAGCDLAPVMLAFAGMPVTVLQAPTWPDRRHFGNQETQANYLDVLVAAGFADPGKLAAMVAAWRGLLDLLRPDIIIADHSPALQVACYGSAVPLVAIGTPYTLPPLDYGQFPPLRADRAPITSEASVLQVALPVVKANGSGPPPNLPALFRTPHRFVFGFPELDPYRAMRQEPLHLPPEPLPEFIEAGPEPRLFAYLGTDAPGFDLIAQALGDIEMPTSAYLRGDIGPLAQFLRLRGVEVYDAPPRLADVLPTVSHVFHGGGATTALAAIAAGRPQLVMPQHGETLTTLRMLDGLGVARRLEPDREAPKVTKAFYDFVWDHRIQQNARHWAMVTAARTQPPGDVAVDSAIRAILA